MANIWYHNKNATGANNGTSWADGFTDIASINGVASAGDIVYSNGQISTASITFSVRLHIVGVNDSGVVDGPFADFDFNSGN